MGWLINFLHNPLRISTFFVFHSRCQKRQKNNGKHYFPYFDGLITLCLFPVSKIVRQSCRKTCLVRIIAKCKLSELNAICPSFKSFHKLESLGLIKWDRLCKMGKLYWNWEKSKSNYAMRLFFLLRSKILISYANLTSWF